MIQRDYVLRLVEQLTRIIEKIIGWRKGGQHVEAKVLIGATAKKMLGLDYKLLEGLQVDDLARLLTTGGEPDPAKLIGAAGLLHQRAEIADIEKDPELALYCRRKALTLYERVRAMPGTSEFLDQAKIGALKEKIGEAGGGDS